MAFKIVNETYITLPPEKPEKYGWIEGYTSNTVGETYLRINCKCIPDEEMYESYKRSGSLAQMEFKPGAVYGEGVRLNKKQVIKLIFELLKWLILGK